MQHQPKHWIPQPPQLFLSRVVPGMHGQGTQLLRVSTQVPLQHSVPLAHVPLLQAQPPLLQV